MSGTRRVGTRSVWPIGFGGAGWSVVDTEPAARAAGGGNR